MSEFLKAFADIVTETKANVFRVAEMVGEGDPEVMEFVGTNPCQDLYSVAKAFVVTAVGMLYDEGKLTPSEVITDVLGDLCPADTQAFWRETTLDMLLTHRVRLPGGFLDIDSLDANEFGKDYLAYTLTYPLLPGDGSKRCYTDAAFYILARAVEVRAGMPVDNFLWERLFFPLGCREMAWSRCPMGHPMGATGLYIRVEDMVKLGAIYLHRGCYRGKRYLSEEWVEMVLSRGYELQSVGVGKAFGKGGMRGQMLLVIPEEDRVVAWQGFHEEGPYPFTEFSACYRAGGIAITPTIGK